MIEASFEAVVPKAINAEFEAVIPREKAFDIVNKDIHIDTNGKYEVKADAGTAMTQVNVEVEVPTNILQEVMIDNNGNGIRAITSIKIAEGVAKIPYFDFRNHTSIPTLVDGNAFASTDSAKFVVPDALYDQWIVATNWDTYKSRIVKTSEFVEPTN